MDSITSTDRLAEVNGGSTYQGAEDSVQQGADSPAPLAPTDVSAAGMVYESQQENQGAQQHSSMLEAQGSVEAEEQPLLEETGEAAPQSMAGMGETSELGGSNYLMDQSVLSGHGKRKSRGSEMGEVADNEDGIEGQDQAPGTALQRVPSDVGMVMGGGPAPVPADACDSNAEFDDLPALLPPAEVEPAMAAAAGHEDALRLTWAQGPTEGVGNMINLADQPSDAEILAWQNQIMEAEAKDQPLVGDREPLEVLQAEYATGSQVFLQKIEKLKESYGSIRRSRGDGNCFYRSFIFGLLESLISTHDEAERDRLVQRLAGLKQALLSAGYEELVFEGPMDMVLQMLRAVDAPIDAITLDALENNMRSGDIGNYVLFMLRMLTSCEIKSRADFFAPFVLGMSDLDVDTFCSRCVDPMGEESDHVQLVALTDTLQVPIRVVYLDRSLGGPGVGAEDGGVHVDMHDFIPEGTLVAGGASQPRVHLLYRPGHYDILYPL